MKTEWVSQEYKSEIRKYFFFKLLKGWQEKVLAFADDKKIIHDIEVYRQRLEKEVKMIFYLGVESYLISVADQIYAAKNMGCTVGAGRGSASGSLVVWLLGITGLDPIKWDLLFERFLNPQRAEAPDIDVDYQDNMREKVRQYIRDFYGKDHVVDVCNFGTLGNRMVVRDIGRVLEMPNDIIDAVSKAMDDGKLDIETVYEQNDSFRTFCDEFPEIWNVAKVLAGQARQIGKHAAGTLITPKPVWEYIPLQTNQEAGTDGRAVVTAWDLDPDYAILDRCKVLKYDILGLATLTVTSKALNFIKQRYQEVIDLDNMREMRLFDDKKVLDNYAAGHTLGVFQFECLHEDTQIEINFPKVEDFNFSGSKMNFTNSRMTIKELYKSWKEGETKQILSFNGKNMVLNDILEVVHKGKKELLKIVTEYGEIFSSYEHKFLVNGKWMKAEELNIGDVLECMASEEKIKLISKAGLHETYDIAMRAPLNNYVANGFIVHNSSGIRKLLRDMKVSSFNDVIAANALYRPGPLSQQMHTVYCNRKNRIEKWKPEHPIIDQVVGYTYGVVIYQEQIMRILGDIGDYEDNEVDTVRRVLTKLQSLTPFAKVLLNFDNDRIEEITIKELYDIWRFGNPPKYILAYDNKQSFVKHKLVNVLKNVDKKKLYKIKTKSGKTLECSIDHKIMTKQGEKRLENLKVGDKILGVNFET